MNFIISTFYRTLGELPRTFKSSRDSDMSSGSIPKDSIFMNHRVAIKNKETVGVQRSGSREMFQVP